jgi:hypothetical protein
MSVFVGGDFLTVNGVAIHNVAKWDGYNWYDLSGGADAEVKALYWLGDVLYVGGRFLNVGAGDGAKVAARIAAYIMAFTPLMNDLGTGKSSARWGQITGDIEDQTDLQAELALKVDIAQGAPAANRIVVTNGSGNVTTDADIAYDATNNILTLGGVAAPWAAEPDTQIYSAEGHSAGRFSLIYSDTLDNSDYDTAVRAGGTASAPTKVLTDMMLKKWRGRGYYDASNISSTQVELRMAANGDWSSTSRPTRIQLYNTIAGATAPVLNMTIVPASAQYKFLVSGATPFTYAESAGGINIASGKIPVFSNTITFAGTDGTTMTFPSTSQSIPGLGLANVWTATSQTLGDGTAANAVSLIVNGAAGYARQIPFKTNGSYRANMLINSTAESGSNVGSDWQFALYDDAGAYLSTPIFIKRSTGQVRIGSSTAPAYALDVTGNIRCSTGFSCNGTNPQTAYASGGAVTPGAGAYGASSAANFAALATLVTNIRAALVANGILS